MLLRSLGSRINQLGGLGRGILARPNAGGAALPGHRYWKITFTQDNGENINFSELEVYDAPYGSNIVNLATITASSDYFSNAGTVIANGVFSSNAERFLFSSAVPQSLKLDFGSGQAKRVDGVGIHFWQKEATGNKGPKAFTVSWSDDDVSYTDEWSVAAQTGWEEYEFRRWVNTNIALSYAGSPHGEHLYWRIFMQDSESADWLNIAEIELLASPGGADQTAGATASPDLYGGHYAADAIDDNNSTFWTPASPKSEFKVVLAAPIKVGAFSVRARGDALANASMKQGVLQFSDDNTYWTTTFGVLGQTGWSLGERRVFTDPAYI